MKKRIIIIAVIAATLLFGVSIFASNSIETFSAMEHKAIVIILVNSILYAAIGIALFKVIKHLRK